MQSFCTHSRPKQIALFQNAPLTKLHAFLRTILIWRTRLKNSKWKVHFKYNICWEANMVKYYSCELAVNHSKDTQLFLSYLLSSSYMLQRLWGDIENPKQNAGHEKCHSPTSVLVTFPITKQTGNVLKLTKRQTEARAKSRLVFFFSAYYYSERTETIWGLGYYSTSYCLQVAPN